MTAMKLARLWPTYVAQMHYDFPELNARLRELAYEIKAEANREGPFFFSRRKSNCFRDYRDPALGKLGQIVCEAVRGYIQQIYEDTTPYKLTIAGWPMIQPHGHHVPAHHHVGSHIAACYYVDVPPVVKDAPIAHSGALVLLDPRATNRDWEPAGRVKEMKYFIVDVTEGLLVLFPGYLIHTVNPWHGSGDRIMYAMNVNVLKDGVDEPAIDESELLASDAAG